MIDLESEPIGPMDLEVVLVLDDDSPLLLQYLRGLDLAPELKRIPRVVAGHDSGLGPGDRPKRDDLRCEPLTLVDFGDHPVGPVEVNLRAGSHGCRECMRLSLLR